MQAHLDDEDIAKIVKGVTEALRPLFEVRNESIGEEILDVEELSAYLKVPQTWIYERTHLKEIPYLKVGGKLRFRRREIEKWLKSFDIPAAYPLSSKHKALR
jgi:excisionase family DNA binding protein